MNNTSADKVLSTSPSQDQTHKHTRQITNKELVQLLRNVAAVYLLKNESRFRIVAYQKAADVLEMMTSEVYDAWENGDIQHVEGLGSSIQSRLDEHFKDPARSYLTKQLARVPVTVFELMKAPGIGPKKAYALVTALDATRPATLIQDIRAAAQENRIAQLDSFGEKSQADILQALDILEHRGTQDERMLLPEALRLAKEVADYLKEDPRVKKIEHMGSLRRRAATIGDVDVLVVCDEKDMQDVIARFTTFPRTLSIEAQGKDKGAIIVSGGWRVDVRTIPERMYGSMIQYFTGSKAHNIKLRERALKQGLSLNEFGIKNTHTGELVEYSSEEAFYAALGLDWIPPELREGHDEIQHALAHSLPHLILRSDIRGEFHVHSHFDVTTSHDLGADSIETMARKAHELGYEYLALSEHNPAFSKVSAHKAAQIIEDKKRVIDAWNADAPVPVHLFNSLEIDIQPDGSLALADEAFEWLDMCVISIHSSFRMSRADMTARIMKALAHPKVKIMGHPTGRQLGKREEIDADWHVIMKEALKRNIALEINASPERLDLPEGLIKQALNVGVKLVIDTDAHAASHMDGIDFGVCMARRGWATKSDIMNTLPLEDIKNWINT